MLVQSGIQKVTGILKMHSFRLLACYHNDKRLTWCLGGQLIPSFNSSPTKKNKKQTNQNDIVEGYHIQPRELWEVKRVATFVIFEKKKVSISIMLVLMGTISKPYSSYCQPNKCS